MILEKYVSKILCDRFKSMRKYRNKSGTILVQIIKAMHGLVHSAALWFEALTLYLRELGFEHNSHDWCVISNKTKKGSLVLVIYVDDILVIGDDDDEVIDLIRKLEKKYETVVVERSDEFTYLGMVLKRLKDDSIEIHIYAYIDSILQAYSKRRKNRGV